MYVAVEPPYAQRIIHTYIYIFATYTISIYVHTYIALNFTIGMSDE